MSNALPILTKQICDMLVCAKHLYWSLSVFPGEVLLWLIAYSRLAGSGITAEQASIARSVYRGHSFRC